MSSCNYLKNKGTTMSRMKQAGYHEDYRKHVLLNALAVYDKKVRDELDGVCPINRPAGYEKIKRKKEKVWRKKNWSTKGGYIAPIIVPATPNGELARMIKKLLRLTMIEKSLQNPNPSATNKCGKINCFIDNQPGGGKLCHKSNVF